jgi:hypothetical protein
MSLVSVVEQECNTVPLSLPTNFPTGLYQLTTTPPKNGGGEKEFPFSFIMMAAFTFIHFVAGAFLRAVQV